MTPCMPAGRALPAPAGLALPVSKQGEPSLRPPARRWIARAGPPLGRPVLAWVCRKGRAWARAHGGQGGGGGRKRDVEAAEGRQRGWNNRDEQEGSLRSRLWLFSVALRAHARACVREAKRLSSQESKCARTRGRPHAGLKGRAAEAGLYGFRFPSPLNPEFLNPETRAGLKGRVAEAERRAQVAEARAEALGREAAVLADSLQAEKDAAQV
jgi:hypothetical protein